MLLVLLEETLPVLHGDLVDDSVPGLAAFEVCGRQHDLGVAERVDVVLKLLVDAVRPPCGSHPPVQMEPDVSEVRNDVVLGGEVVSLVGQAGCPTAVRGSDAGVCVNLAAGDAQACWIKAGLAWSGMREASPLRLRLCE